MRTKVAIYCRLSEEDRHKQSKTDDSESIQNQKSMLLQYAMEQRWELYSIDSDDDYAGADRKRPQSKRAAYDRNDCRVCEWAIRTVFGIVIKYHKKVPKWHQIDAKVSYIN